MSKHHYAVGDEIVLSARSHDDAVQVADHINTVEHRDDPLVVIDADTPSQARDTYWRQKNAAARRLPLQPVRS